MCAGRPLRSCSPVGSPDGLAVRGAAAARGAASFIDAYGAPPCCGVRRKRWRSPPVFWSASGPSQMLNARARSCVAMPRAFAVCRQRVLPANVPRGFQ